MWLTANQLVGTIMIQLPDKLEQKWQEQLKLDGMHRFVVLFLFIFILFIYLTSFPQNLGFNLSIYLSLSLSVSLSVSVCLSLSRKKKDNLAFEEWVL